jgi:hypothetical protein
MLYATGPAGLATLVRGSSRRITIMRFRPANIRLINRRSNLPRLLLPCPRKKQKQQQRQKQPHGCAGVDRVTPYQSNFGNCVDRSFGGIPPIPQINAEWVGHGSL